MEHHEKRSTFSGKLGFVLSAAGASVGLGNIWRFPYLAAKYGGGIFLLIYIILALTFGYTKAIAKLGLNKKNVAAVGDQIFTDVLGSNLKGIRSIFVFPIEPETSLPFRFKRTCEKPFLPKLK